MRLTQQDWIKLSPMLTDALGLDVVARQAYLANVEAQSPDFARMLRKLIAADERAQRDNLLETIPRLPVASPQSIGLSAGARVGPFELISELGIGGMGSVWLARYADGTLKREVALKLPHLNVARTDLRKRFDRERDILAGLAHPHIARLYEAGLSQDGLPYLAIEYVQGDHITAYCDRHSLSLRARIELFLQVIDAVQFAHQQLVVHRDLKPANILVTPEGQVRLLDFGIAKLLSTQAQEGTQLTQLVGNAMTVRYAAPEQIKGQAISTVTDVYALAVILYELVTGVSPYDLAGTAGVSGAVQQRIGKGELRRFAQLRQEIDLTTDTALARGYAQANKLSSALTSTFSDVETILLKALKTEPNERYRSAAEFADDLRRYLADKPVLAKPDSVGYTLRKFVQRHLKTVVASAIAIAIAIGLFITTLWQSHVAKQEAKRAEEVRIFMSNLLSSAQPMAGGSSGEVTARDMLASGLNQAKQGYADQPQIKGMLLSEMGRIYGQLGDDQLSMGLLQEANQLLEAHATPSNTELNRNRGLLAIKLAEQGKLDEAQLKANAALRDCTAASIECAKARAYAHDAWISVYQAQGKSAQALASARQNVAELERAYSNHPSFTVVGLYKLAEQARAAQLWREADAANKLATARVRDGQTHVQMLSALSGQRLIIDVEGGAYRSGHAQALAEMPSLEPASRYSYLEYRTRALTSMGDARAARQMFNRTMVVAEQNKVADDERQWLRLVESRLLLREGELPKAAALLEPLDKASLDVTMQVYFNIAQAELALLRGELNKANQYIEQWLTAESAVKPENPVRQAAAYELQALIATLINQPAKATEAISKATQLSGSLLESHPRHDRLRLMQLISQSKGDPQQRQQHMQEVQQLAQKILDRYPDPSFLRSEFSASSFATWWSQVSAVSSGGGSAVLQIEQLAQRDLREWGKQVKLFF